MTNIDQEIRKALMEGESEEIQELGKAQSLLERSIGLFKGQERWINILFVLFSAVFFFVGVYTLIKFLYATGATEMIGYGMLMILTFLMVLGLRLWLWMEMNKNSVIREILRLELRIQEISKKLDRA